MYKSKFNMRECPVRFKCFQRKGYSLFNCLGREVLIGALSVATLTHASASGMSTMQLKSDTVRQATWEISLEDIDVKGSRAPLSTGQAARIVTVLDREQINCAPVQSVNDLLKYVSGIDVRQRGAIGSQTDISIRGGTQEQIAVFLNGINICDPQTGHNAFDLPVDLSEIERIEVLEGPAGRVYGASSLLGAINVVTRMPEKGSVDLHAEGGSYGYLSAGGRINLTAGAKWNNQFSGNVTRSDGYSRSKAGSLNADYAGGKLFYQGRYDVGRMRLNWHAGMSVKGFGANTFYSARFDEQYEKTTKLYTALKGEFDWGRFHLQPSLYWNRNHDRFELIRGSEDNVPFNYHRTDVLGAHLNAYFDWQFGRTAVGAEFRNEDIVSGNLGEPLDKPVHIHGTGRDYLFGLNRSNISFSAEHNLLLRSFTLSAGFVLVKNTWNKMPFTFYPGIDASVRIGDNWKLYASYNTSLRMPSFTELYYSVGGHKADKYLKAEELNAYETGVKYLSPFLTASASLFHHRCRNMIDWVMDTSADDPVWESVNYTKVNTVGFETTFHFDFRHILSGRAVLRNLTVAYTYLNEDKDDVRENVKTQSTLEYLRHKLVANVSLNPFKSFTVGVNYRFQDRAGTYTDVNGVVQEYKGYSVVDCRMAWEKPTYSFFIEANNLFGAKYVDYGNVPQPGAWFIAGVKYRFDL